MVIFAATTTFGRTSTKTPKKIPRHSQLSTFSSTKNSPNRYLPSQDLYSNFNRFWSAPPVSSLSAPVSLKSSRRFFSANEQIPEPVLDIPPAALESVGLEIKDPDIIFKLVMSKLETKYGRNNMIFPKEIIWLVGGPGAGKGTNTPFIQKVRMITEPAVVMSDLLVSPEAQKIKAEGGLVSDSMVLELLLETLLLPKYRIGVIIDGFPRTPVQVKFVVLLHTYMNELRTDELNRPISERKFPRPSFRVAVLFVTEKESIDRQMKRGKEIRERNLKAAETGDKMEEERATDTSEEAARKRYQIFKEHYSTLQTLRQHFVFTVINASKTIPEVQKEILKEFQYQSSMELSEETFDAIETIPLLETVIANSRQQLVNRLDSYQFYSTDLFYEVIKAIKFEFVPRIKLHAFGGYTTVRTDNKLFDNPQAVEMAIDVLSERGYQVQADAKESYIPTRFDPTTLQIACEVKKTHLFHIRFRVPTLRKATEL